ncbi:MAG: c-type cytochrome domain-containing protein [Planctomycetaceae bacterium]
MRTVLYKKALRVNFDQVSMPFLIDPTDIVARRDHAMYPSFSFAFVSRLIRLRHLLSRIAVTVIVASGQIESVFGDESADAQFENHIRPVLVETCFRCHGDLKVSGKLRVDSREALLEGGESGAAIVPGKPEESLLIKAIQRHEDVSAMPPEKDKALYRIRSLHSQTGSVRAQIGRLIRGNLKATNTGRLNRFAILLSQRWLTRYGFATASMHSSEPDRKPLLFILLRWRTGSH